MFGPVRRLGLESKEAWPGVARRGLECLPVDRVHRPVTLLDARKTGQVGRGANDPVLVPSFLWLQAKRQYLLQAGCRSCS